MGDESIRSAVVIVMSKGVSVKDWYNCGTLDQEIRKLRFLVDKHLCFGADLLIYQDRPHDSALVKDIPVFHKLHELGNALSSYTTSYLLYSQVYALGLLHKFFPQKHFISVNLRVGYLPSRLHLKNKRYTAYLKSKLLEKIGNFLVDKVFFTDSAAASVFDASKCVAIPQLVSEQFYSYRCKPVPGADLASFLYVGRLEIEKGVNLFQAFEKLNAKLTIVGHGSYRFKSAANISFLGGIRNELLPPIFAAHTHYLCLSPSEGAPKAVIEAHLAGLRVIKLKGSYYLPEEDDIDTLVIPDQTKLVEYLQQEISLFRANSDLRNNMHNSRLKYFTSYTIDGISGLLPERE
jgi:glycosyltransferase involved in cell wall biosynthesis